MSLDQSYIHDLHMSSSPSTSSSSSSSSRPFRRYFLPCVTRQDSLVSAEPEVAALATLAARPPQQQRRASQPVLPLFRTQQPPQRERRIQSLESGRLLELNEDDLDAIQRSWNKIPDKILWCQRMFLKLFSVREHIKKTMGYNSMGAKQILQCPHFESHCQRFVGFWNNLVRTLCQEPPGSMTRAQSASCGNLDADTGPEEEQVGPADRVVGKIRELGLLHCQMPGVTFDAECWLMFKNLLIESVCGQHFDIRDKTCLGWCKLIMFVISEMKDAFNEGVRARCNTL